MIDMAHYHRIKFLKEVEGLSQRQIARKLGISRNTVSKYMKQEEAPTLPVRQRSYGKKEYSEETQRILPIIDQWLLEDQKHWVKQKHTAARIYQRLVKEYQFKGSSSNIRKLVAKRRQKQQEVFIPLEFRYGLQFQFDWGEADVILQGKTQRIFLFCLQLSSSRFRFVRAYTHQKQEAFLDGFVHAFEFLGGVPVEGLFDNLKTAVVKVLKGRDRLEQEAFIALQAHYGFKATFANPRRGNEKGRVEGTVGYVRRNALVPYPDVQSMDELNHYLMDWCLKEAARIHVPRTDETVAQVWAKEKLTLHSLPGTPFEACRLISCQVNQLSLIHVETNQYSVPCAYVGQAVWVKQFVDRLIIVAQNQVITEYPRSYGRNQLFTRLDHYLEALLKKPRAIRDAHPFQNPDIPEIFRHFHRRMRETEGAAGDRKFVRLLLLHRELGLNLLTQAIQEAERKQIFTYEAVHEVIQKMTGNVAGPVGQAPEALENYKVKVTDINQYRQLVKEENQ
ncbi:IS21 family transposase [Terrilactibacillus sp. BCM23-1]|uniref:IS21 family transposase n=3 Tax=Bacillales TaxID=1385 RepID=A0A6N8CNH1_9BACI|nr:IS21 family transposase [Terrilactibacillus tamarindi]MTT31632.1 IS21 family transposase [Terrilactibacillus tamarindi]